MKTTNKPKYSLAQNVGWMVKIAWNTRKRVLLFCVLTAAVNICSNLAQLYIAPEVLKRVEQHASLGSLLITIALFTGALLLASGVREYLDVCDMCPHVDVRSAIIGFINQKSNKTSYPNTLQADYIKLHENALESTSSNDSSTEIVWEELATLLQSVGGFVIYLAILSRLNMLLMLIVIATCVAGFLVSRNVQNWLYAHRDEKTNSMPKRSTSATNRNPWCWQRTSAFSGCRTG